LKNSKEIILDSGKKVEIKKLPLKKYAELLQAIQELPKHIGDLDKLTPTQILEKLPFLIGVAYPDIVQVTIIATDLPKEEVEELGLDELTDLFGAFFEVNNYSKVIDNLKKMFARPTAPAQIQKTS